MAARCAHWMSQDDVRGVVVTHGGLSNFAAETAQRFDVGPGCRVLHFATPSFDAAMLDLLFALGGAATLVRRPVAASPANSTPSPRPSR